ncbi:MAG: flagellar biosynthesis protein FlhA [Candidatus Omnitrophica bacterium]|nr:flagellar biosynthesis protein FlhA [Candidatus Omnitrophota bacterium]MCB9768155.1 flagellar biosynthesis protein FlhA [Candidatus Omnitrophota bacterium]
MANSLEAPRGLMHPDNRANLLAAVGIISILFIMLGNIPPWMLSSLLAFNIALALMVLMISFYITGPLDFSTFPSVILVLTLFRLALNVASTKLILLPATVSPEDKAGAVINFFGSYVAGNNPVVGFVIFMILILIQFIVITRGSNRIAEVAARFTLDAMPGKQLSIDQDLNSGLITEDEARKKREDLAREADFFGAMDGASRFVRGDAIAGIVITLINIVGGLVVGMTQDGLSFSETLSTYTLLTIGDGLVSQIPALLISTAAGIVVTRAASADSLGASVSKQILAQPTSLAVSAATLSLLGLLSLASPETRGIFLPFAMMASAMGGMWYLLSRREKEEYEHRIEERKKEMERPTREAEPPESFLRVDPMELMIGYNLVPMMDSSRGGDFLDQVASIRRNIALELGVVVPQIRIRDNMQLGANEYSIRIRGVQVAQGEILPDQFLAINPGGDVGEVSGVHTTEPAFGVPAVWVTSQNRGAAELAGYNVIEPSAVLATHLTEIIRTHAAELLDRQATQKLIDGVKEECPVVVNELVEGPQAIGVGKIQKVLQNLLSERVPIRNLPHILEILADNSAVTKEVDPLTEFVRVGLSMGIVQNVVGHDGTLSVIVLDQAVEQEIQNAARQTSQGSYVALDPTLTQRLIEAIQTQLDEAASLGLPPVLLVNPQIRLVFSRLIRRYLPGVTVLSYTEVTGETNLRSIGTVTLQKQSGQETPRT